MKSTKPDGSNRDRRIDFLRAAAIVSVFGIHTTTLASNYPVLTLQNVILGVINVYSYMAVPLFVFISGYVLYTKYSSPEVRWLDFYKKRFMRIIPPYSLAAVIYYVYFNRWDGRPLSLMEFLRLYLTFNVYPLFWFVRMILTLYLLFPLFVKAWKRYGTHLLIVMFAIQFLGQSGTLMYFSGIEWARPLAIEFFSYVFYFTLGFYASDRRDSWERKTTKFTSPAGATAAIAASIA